MVQTNRSKLTLGFRIIDALTIFSVLWGSVLISGGHWGESYNLAATWAVGFMLFFGQMQNLYRTWRGAPLRQDIVRIWLTWLTATLGLLLLAYATKTSADYSRRVILTWFIITPVSMILWRAFLHMLLGTIRAQGINIQRVAIVGAREIGADLARTILKAPWMGLQPVGFYDDRKVSGDRPLETEPISVIGNLGLLEKHAHEGTIDVVYITLPLRAEERIKILVNKLADTTVSVYIVPDFFLSHLYNANWGNIGNLPTVSIYETPFYGVDGMIKRIEDFILTVIILMIAAIPMIIIAIIIKMTSPGSVIFKQHRYGLRGNHIEIWKFRTMNVSEDGDQVKQVQSRDSRVTSFGRFLRRTSLDELPQFFNVLQGKMSIVGPRPHAVAHNEQYRKIINGYMLRHKVKPGITGLAQINGWRGETDTLDKMQMRIENDLSYIRNWSLWLDLKIIFLTISRIFFCKNAY